MNLNKPVAYREFKLWPKDIQEQYLTHLNQTYHASYSRIGKMMGAGVDTVLHYIKVAGLNVPEPVKGIQFNAEQQKLWDAFCAGELGDEESVQKDEEATPMVTDEATQKMLDEMRLQAEEANSVKPATPKPCANRRPWDDTTFVAASYSFDCFNGNRAGLFSVIEQICAQPWPDGVHFSISVSDTLRSVERTDGPW